MNIGRFGVFGMLTLAGIYGCGSSSGEPVPFASEDTAPEPEPDAGGTAVVPGTPVVAGESPEGIFVSASKGSDSSDGARMRPVKTISVGLGLAATKKLPLFVCVDTYRESVTLADGVTMRGYFDCSDLSSWKRTERRSSIVSPTSPAVIAIALSARTRFEGFDVQAPDQTSVSATGAAQSSIGMFVNNTSNLELAEVSLRGGRGQDGRDGVESTPPTTGLASQGSPARPQRGCDAAKDGLGACVFITAVKGGEGGQSLCGGGPGGNGGSAPVARQGAYAAHISIHEATGAPGATATFSTAAGGLPIGLASTRGKDGLAGVFGASGKNGAWSFSATGFSPGDGTAGEAGRPGQGGGGGAGSIVLYNSAHYPAPSPYMESELPIVTTLGFTGAGGGAGGCGGVPGTAGTGGGASVGLMVISSAVTMVAGSGSLIRSGAGGRAGRGTLGSLGSEGGQGGSGQQYANELLGSAGGRGGDGGASGLSGSGAPGPSFALVYTGARPVLGDTQLFAGAAGLGAPALSRGTQALPATTTTANEEYAF